MGGPKHNNRFGRTPAKGSQLRMILRMMLRPEGVTLDELFEVGIKRSRVAALLTVLEDQKGWDIRTFPAPPWRTSDYGGYSKVIYRVVGKMRWDGTYRSLIPKELQE